MGTLKIYGASDDLVEIEGDFEEEIGAYDCGNDGDEFLAVSDGTLLTLCFTSNYSCVTGNLSFNHLMQISFISELRRKILPFFSISNHTPSSSKQLRYRCQSGPSAIVICVLICSPFRHGCCAERFGGPHLSSAAELPDRPVSVYRI